MTVGEFATSYAPLQQLAAAPLLRWSVANSTTIGLGNWSATSAVCMSTRTAPARPPLTTHPKNKP